jgi:hypothetical protein
MENNIEVFDELHYGNGEFDFVRDDSTREFLKSAHRAISLCELWDWMRFYTPPPNTDFTWNKTPELNRINQQLWNDPVNEYHSESSYDFIMREMEIIAKNGYNSYKNIYNGK